VPSVDAPRDARIRNLVQLYLEAFGRKSRDSGTIAKQVKNLAESLDLDEAREPLYATLVHEACAQLEFEIPHHQSPDSIGVDGDDAQEDPSEPPNWIHEGYEWPQDGLWIRYRRYLLGRFSPEKVDALGKTCDDILRRLGNPKSPREKWTRFGACIGQVQSGKTQTYIGLIAKAVDAGYVNVIVLSGLHNSLRSQTQFRVDEGLVGKTKIGDSLQTCGVGDLTPSQREVSTKLQVLTTAQDDGDFSPSAQLWQIVDAPAIMVIKKNVSRLKKLRIEMTADQKTWNPRYSRPTIIIDDESDQASVNAKGADSPSAVNKEIRLLVDLFDRCSIVGFTATPFANMFIDPNATFEDVESERKVPDLYPRDMIRLLPVGPEYFGPKQMLAYEGSGPRFTAPADDYKDWLVPHHKKEHVPGAIPESLKNALALFMIGVAIKRLRKGVRGEAGFDFEMNEHATMLVHVTRFTRVQSLVRDQIRDEFLEAKEELLGGSAEGPWHLRLRAQFEEIETMGESLRESLDPELCRWLVGQPVEYARALACLRDILPQFEIEVVNGEISDALRYRQSRERIIVAVGGDKLSRGLTLEGLTVSYYLRNANSWDTLMQMGRWFGYRERYLDLCRVFVPSELELAYEEVLEGIVDLEEQLRKAAISGAQVRDFCLTLLASPSGRQPTGRMGNQRRIRQVGGYGASLIQKRNIPIDAESAAFRNARSAFGALLRDATPFRHAEPSEIRAVHGADESMLLFKEVPSAVVREFIVTAGLPTSGQEESAEEIAEYLQQHENSGRLTQWTIGIPNVRRYPEWDRYEPIPVGEYRIGPSRRGNQGHGDGLIQDMPGFRRIVTLIGPAHEGAGLTEKQRKDGGIFGKSAAEINGEQYREARRIGEEPVEGLLLVYPVVNSKQKSTDSGQPHHEWSVAWAMSLPPIEHDRKVFRHIPQATYDAYARARRLDEEDQMSEEDAR